MTADPAARERLARWLYLEDGGSAEVWDGIPAAVEKAAAVGLKVLEADEYNECLRRADKILTVMADDTARQAPDDTEENR